MSVEVTDVDPLIGRVFASRYKIEAELGAGAMGTVYKARHVKVGRPFAVKMLHERLLLDDKLKKRFDREAELAGKLHHINVVGVVDVGETEDGIHFMVMEFADGVPLGSLMSGPMATNRVIGLVQQLCDGLQHAHEHGLIHRDFKPDNVIVERDRFGTERPRIVDFGIAILRDDAVVAGRADRLTTAGLVLGTPHYMAPEHAMGAGIDHRIDLFALGVICYELLTGQLPYDGDGVDVARANLMIATPPMGIRVPGVTVDPLLEAFTRHLMEKDPAKRPQSAKDARRLVDLIATDRAAAAAALGVELPATPVESSEPVVAARVTVPERRPDAVSTAAAAPAAPRVATEPGRAPAVATVSPRPRGLLGIGIAVGLVVIVVLVGLIAMRRGGSDASAPRDAAPAIAIAPTDVSPPPAIDAGTAIDAGAVEAVAQDAALSAADAATVADATVPRVDSGLAKPKPVKPRPPKPPPPVKPPVYDTSGAGVAQLYGTVGRELKALDTRRGSAATSALWPRYLRIRINDALTTPEKRAEAHRALTALRSEIAAQR